MHDLVNMIVEMVSQFGYFGIFVMMFLESTFFPFPSEVAMVPAGYLAFKGEMNLPLAILAGTTGSLAGALFNYYLAKKFGRLGVLSFGKYFFFKEDKLEKMENFFINHGSFSTFIGRLIPGVRQLISLPAGLSKMPVSKFSIYTSLGAGIWTLILAVLGFYIGSLVHVIDPAKPYLPQVIEASKPYLHQIVYLTLGIIVVISVVYMISHKRKNIKVIES